MSIRHREHPELDHPPVTRPCSVCEHQVSRYRWEGLGLRKCSLCGDGLTEGPSIDAWPAGIAEEKRRRAEDQRQKEGDVGTPGKLAGRGPLIVDRRDAGESFKAIATDLGVSDVAVREKYWVEKALRTA